MFNLNTVYDKLHTQICVLLNHCLKFLFFFLIVKPIVNIVVGLNVRHRERLPNKGPLIVVANHNSHMDTLVLISLFSFSKFSSIRPVAAADYFLKNSFIKWFSTKIMGIIPIKRQKNAVSNLQNTDPLTPIYQSLEKNEIIILFPEGTRGEPEQRQKFKKGISYLSEKFPNVPIIPIFLHGLGKTLPRGEFLLVPFFCDIFIGNPLERPNNRLEFMEMLEKSFTNLAHEGHFQNW